MNIKDFLLPLGLGLITMWAIQNIFFKKDTKGSQASMTSFVASEPSAALQPINTEIDFTDTSSPQEIIQTKVDTPTAHYVFSEGGAALISASFKRPLDGSESFHTTISHEKGVANREQASLLLALNEQTPFLYTLKDIVETDADIQLTYQAHIKGGAITKTFVIYKNASKIDLKVDLKNPTAFSPQGVVPRIVFTGPYMEDLGEREVVSGIVIDANDRFSKIGKSNIQPAQGWIQPRMFGADSRYYIHAMVSDPQLFVQRSYYKVENCQKLVSFLEGGTMLKDSQWKLSFYYGPKDSQPILAVDPRLEKTLDYYGWLSIISKFLLSLLKWLFTYVHNYGFAIIILTILMKLVMLPFTIGTEKSIKQQKENRKKLEYIERKYKDDQATLARERAEFVRKNGVPGLGSCLPLLLQIPIFFALSRVLSSSIELYQAPMLWIKDLSAPDPLYILPFLVMVGMLASALFADASQRVAMVVMALVFAALSASFSSGLALYITVSTLLGVLQSYCLRSLGWNRAGSSKA